MASTAVIENPFNKTMEEFYFKNHHKGKHNESVVGSYSKSVATCHKCGKKCHSKGNLKSNRNSSCGELSEKSTRKLPKWIIKRPMI